MRLETRHWIIIAIMVIATAGMYNNVPLEQMKDLFLVLAGLAGADFVIKRVKDAKGIA